MNNALYKKEVICPVCKNVFNTQKVRMSAVRIKKRDSDFCVYYEGENPLFYAVFVCPNCGYAALENVFNDISLSEKKVIESKISSRWIQRDLGHRRNIEDAIEVYKLALLCAELSEQKKDRLGIICLRLSWWYRYLGDVEQEKVFLQYAVNCFEDDFRFDSGFSKNLLDEASMLYLLGELNRRLGRYKEAISWFNRTVSHPNIENKKGIELRAREQWQLTRESYVKEERINKEANYA